MSIKAVLFDLDGVLVDLVEAHYLSFNQALRDISDIVLSKEEHEKDFNGLSTLTKLDMLAEQGRIQASDIEKIYDLKQNVTKEFIKDIKIDLEKIELFIELKKLGLKTACVSNAIYDTVYSALKATGIDEYIDFIVSNEDLQFNKPNPAPYMYAMTMLAVSPFESLIIEDSDKGIEAAKASAGHILCVHDSLEVNRNNILKTIKIIDNCICKCVYLRVQDLGS